MLFAAIGVSAWASADGVTLEVPAAVGTLGLVLFAYTVGVISGPAFFAAARSGAGPILSVVGGIGAAAAVAVGLGNALGLDMPTVAGTFAGGLTNTPALAAASERAGNAAGPTIGYSIAYIFGVVWMLGATAFVLRHRRHDADAPPKIVNVTVRVDLMEPITVAEVVAAHDGQIALSRLRHGETGPIWVPEPGEPLRRHDLVTVVGPHDVVEAAVELLGHVSSHPLTVDRTNLDFRRITLSRRRLAGRTVQQLDLGDRFGAIVTRVRRGDVDLLAADDLVLQPGDRLRVIAPRESIEAISRELGDSERGLSDINPVGLAAGLLLGVLVGVISVPLPGGGFEVGAAAGSLLVGLLFGRLGRIGPLVTTLPHTAASALSQLGMLAFLAYAGAKAGEPFRHAVGSGAGWRIAVLGAVLTLLFSATVVITGRRLHRVGATRLAGIVAGAQTQPAVLAFANERTAFDTRVALGYALVYPAAMIAKILLAQVIAGL